MDLSQNSALGERLRQSRRSRGMSLTTLAASAGVSKGFLSQLENGHTQASVRTLTRIAEAVGSSVAELLAQPDGPVKAAQALSVHFGGAGVTDRLLSPVGLPGFQVLQAQIEPGGCSAYGSVDEAESHFIYVLSGTLTLTLNDTIHTIDPTESFAFTTPARYGWANAYSEPTRLLWVASPPPLI